MSMDFGEDLKHYFKMPDFVIFLLLASVSLCLIYYVFYIFARSKARVKSQVEQEFYSLSERFYELIFAGASIIGFMSIYFSIYLSIQRGTFKYLDIWEKYSDFLLLGFMVASILFNTILDHLIVRLKHLDRDTMASIRLIAMVYTIIILCYLRFVYGSKNYDSFIPYFLTIMIGRFVYFDTSFKEFLQCMRKALYNLPIMLIAYAYLGIMCAYGYNNGYLIKHNGVITNIFFTHLFMVLAIFIFRFFPMFVFFRKTEEEIEEEKNHKNGKPKSSKSKKDTRRDDRRADKSNYSKRVLEDIDDFDYENVPRRRSRHVGLDEDDEIEFIDL